MSEAKPFSLAVVKGASVGQVLRTVRRRISVGAADDNDLVLDDADIAARHFLVLIEAGSWRIHTLTNDDTVTVDRQWAHPETGKRGALITAATAEILLYPGELDQRIIDLEVNRRSRGERSYPELRIEGLVTNVDAKGASFPDDENVANEPTMAVQISTGEELHYANAPTIASGRPPEDLREAARARLQGERHPSSDRRNKPIAPSILADPLENQPVRTVEKSQPWEEKTVGFKWDQGQLRPKPQPQGSAWDRAKKPEVVPEILAEPESQMTRIPGAAKSVMTARPDFARPQEAEVIELKPASAPPRGNAWGDRSEVRQEPKNAWGDPKPPTNAWGEPKNALVRREPERNAWGDASARGGERARGFEPAARDDTPPTSRPEASGQRIRVEDLLSRAPEHALQILREPDGSFATSIRLLSTKVEELNRTLGYRMYLVSSAEPLAGKTTVACNLAFALAEDTHRRVALIEANFRYPRFAEIFGLDERLGVLSVIEGRAQVPEAAVRLADRNLVILPSGGRHPHPGEALASPRFKQLIGELANTVDIAIVDTSSVTPSADVNLILPLVDGALMVVSDRSTRSGWLHKATTQLGENRIFGAIYNQLPKGTRKGLRQEQKLRLKQR